MTVPDDVKFIREDANIGCWQGGVERGEIPYVQEIGPVLATEMFRLLGRVPYEAANPVTGLYDLSGCFDDGSTALLSLKPYASDTYIRPANSEKGVVRRDEIDIRLSSAPFIGPRGGAAYLHTIVCAKDFRLERKNTLSGGRKIMPATSTTREGLPRWDELDWTNVEGICPIENPGIITWLGRLGDALDRKPLDDFERMAAELGLTA